MGFLILHNFYIFYFTANPHFPSGVPPHEFPYEPLFVVLQTTLFDSVSPPDQYPDPAYTKFAGAKLLYK